MTHARIGAAVLLAFATALAGCGSPTSPSELLHVEVTDAVGDAVKAPFGPTPPDLVSGVLDLSEGSAKVSIRFAPGTYDPAIARVFIYLDVDQKVTTGVRNESNLGVDYWVDISDSRASLSRCQSNSNVCPSIGSVTLAFVTDGFDVSVPLSQLGGDDGKMDFRVKSDTVALSDRDFMPDLALAPGHVK